MPGIYDKEAEELIKRTGAKGVLLLVIEGNKGSGMSFAERIRLGDDTEQHLVTLMPEMLEHMAKKMREETPSVEAKKL